MRACFELRFGSEEKTVPLGDCEKALSLLLELALQRGTLQHILDAILLLLQLADKASKSNELVKGEECRSSVPLSVDPKEDASYPLAPFLRRMGQIPVPQLPNVEPSRSDAVSGLG